MAITGSGEIKLVGDVNNEINGNTTDTNVSLTSLSVAAEKAAPHGLTEFYGYSAAQNYNAHFLVVSGGASAGSGYVSGGGGAGGLRTSYGSTNGGGQSMDPQLSLAPSTSYTVTVGAAGGNSSFANITTTAGSSGGGSTANGQSGGSAGSYGYGGGGAGNSFYSAGGGGGAGAAASTGPSNGGGCGGAGIAISITGSSVTYAAGGRGYTGNYSNCSALTSAFGGGGNASGGAGQAGVVILRVPTVNLGAITGTHTTGTTGSDTWIQWTGSGTYVNGTPTVTVQASSSIGQTSMTLNGTITVGGGSASTAHGFYIGTSSTYSNNTKVTVGSGAGVGAYTYNATGLTAGTTYYVTAWASNASGEGVSSNRTDNTTQPGWVTFGTYNKQGGSNHHNGSGENGYFTLTNSGSLGNTSISSTKWRLRGTADSGAYSNEYWHSLYIENSAGTQLGSSDVSSMSLTYPCYQYLNTPSNAWDNNTSTSFWATGGSCDHTNSIVELTFSSSQIINKFWLGTGYTKVSQMALEYYG